jgi:uncharacterized repeat protein (TIGR01451 family)
MDKIINKCQNRVKMNKISNMRFIALLLLILAVILSFGVEDVVAGNIDYLAPEITDTQPTSNITLPDNPESTTKKTPEITDTQPTSNITLPDNPESTTEKTPEITDTQPITTTMADNVISITSIPSTTITVEDKVIDIQTTSTLNLLNNNLNQKNDNPNENILSILSSFLSLPSLNIPNLINPTPELIITTKSTVSPFIPLFLAINNSEILQTIIGNIQIDPQFTLNNVLSNKRNFQPVSENNIAINLLIKNTTLYDALNVSPTINTDLSVNMDYYKDLTDYKTMGYNTNNDKLIYGTDTVVYTINVTNNGPEDAKNVLIYDLLPSSLTLIKADASEGTYNNGEWQIENLSKGKTETLKIKAKVARSGYISNQAQVKVKDANPTNNIICKNIQAHNPVILVNGFMDDTSTWNDLGKRLKQEGIRHFIFDYSQVSTDEPYNVAHNLFEPYVNNLKNTQGYQGKFDVVCHSTGALLTRFYMEDNGNKNSENVGQWIGIGPVNQGLAAEDLIANPDLNPEIAYRINQYSLFYKILPSDSAAAIHMQTSDPKIKELNKDGLAPNVIYRVIMGVNAQEIPGLDTIGKFGNTYKLTSFGDGFIANEQSILPAAASNDIITGLKHSKLPQSHEVEDMVVNYLKTA